MSRISHYLSLVKFSHTVFALPFALVGFVMGLKAMNYQFDLKTAVLVLICMVAARTAAMAFNRWADYKIDAQNERTRRREIPAGIISPSASLTLVIVSSSVFIISAGFINRLCLLLSPVALAVILGYSYTKRFTSLSHFILGLGLSFAPIGAYLAVTGKFDWLPVIVSLAVLLWVGGFDIIYSLQDMEFDRNNNLYSIPAALGIRSSLLLSRVLHTAASALLLAVYFFNNQSALYLLAWIVFSFMLVRQHWLVSPTDLSKVNVAFFTMNGIASVIFGLLVTADLLINRS